MTEVLEKDCLCEGLGAPALLSAGETPRRNLKAVTICPGPNLAYFKGSFSLKEMVDHIYGKVNLTLDPERPHVFVKELQLYLQHLRTDIENALPENGKKMEVYINKFKKNLSEGIAYYQDMKSSWSMDNALVLERVKAQLAEMKLKLQLV